MQTTTSPANLLDTADADSVRRWDANAYTRRNELESSGDPAYRALTNLIGRHTQSIDSEARDDRVLDIGCGLGFLSASIRSWGYSVDAIDPSTRSVEIARALHPGVQFHALSLHQYRASGAHGYDLAIANMTLHCVSDLVAFMADVADVLRPGGSLLATIPNPETYLQSRDDVDTHTVDLSVAQTLEVPFRIHGHPAHPVRVVFYHRPFRNYSRAFRSAGFIIDDVSIPEQVGPGRSRDVAVLRVVRYQEQ